MGKMVLKVNGFALLPTQRIVDVLRDGDEVTVSRNCDKPAATLQPDARDLASTSPSKAPRRQIFHDISENGPCCGSSY